MHRTQLFSLLFLLAFYGQAHADQAAQTKLLRADWLFEAGKETPVVLSFTETKDPSRMFAHACSQADYRKNKGCRNGNPNFVTYDSDSESFCREAYQGAKACSLRYHVNDSAKDKIEESLIDEKTYKSAGRKITP